MLASVMRACAFLSLLTTTVSADEHCVVLQYNLVSDSAPGIISVPPDLFQAHLEHLQANDYAVRPLDEVVEHLRNGRRFPSRCVALTVDAPVRAVFDEIRPRIRGFDFPVTLFVSPGPIDAGAKGTLGWDELRTLRAEGFGIQNRGLRLDNLARRAPDESLEHWQQRVAFGIQLAQSRIEQELGVRPTLFAYPFGEYTNELKAIVESMGLAAFGMQPGAIWSQSDLALLPRLPIASFTATMAAFENHLQTRPLRILGAFPADPVVPLDQWRPDLTIVFPPEIAHTPDLDCRLNGAPGLQQQWLDQPPNAVLLTPLDHLREGVNRVDCVLPSTGGGLARFSHLWLRRDADGNWPGQASHQALRTAFHAARHPQSGHE